MCGRSIFCRRYFEERIGKPIGNMENQKVYTKISFLCVKNVKFVQKYDY